ncbi:hypothetical protein [Trebonia sp.]|uniref:DUF7455 domain-containing protein n=1 Tax=Trebonia sp. TaxID=2767075 RepID=UPI0026329F8D|nr:hypothetical protein [Trebonia sp.]
MKSLFAHPSDADPVWLAEELPGPGKPLTLVDRACCCPARPVVTVIMPPGPGHPFAADLLLCGHHYKASRAALRAAGATVYDAAGMVITPGDDGDSGDSRGPAHGGRREVPAPRSAHVKH